MRELEFELEVSPVDNAAPARPPRAAQRIKGLGGRLRALQEFKIQSLFFFFFLPLCTWTTSSSHS